MTFKFTIDLLIYILFDIETLTYSKKSYIILSLQKQLHY